MSDFSIDVEAKLDTTNLKKQIDDLQNEKITLKVDTGNTSSGVQNVQRTVVTATKSANTFGTALRNALNIGSAASIAYKSIDLISDALKKGYHNVINIDKVITDLRMATGGTYSETMDLVKGYNQMGKQLGATTTEVSESADAWLRQGKSAQEANILIRDAMILSKVGQIDSASATEYLTSAMKGYGVATSDVIGIVDKLSAVDMSSATDAGGLAEAMSRTAVTANMAGVSMNQLLGYIAAVGEVTQKSMSSVGESFKTIFQRMSDIKSGKLELIDADGTTESLSDVETALKNVGIDLRETVTSYGSYGEILDSLAAKWDGLTEVQQNALTKAFAGTRQSENFRVLMENYDSAKQYMEIAANSAGTAAAKFSAYTESIESKLNSLQAAFESLSLDVISPEGIGDIISGTTAIVSFIDKINLLKGTLAGLGVAGAVQGFTMLGTGIMNAATKMSQFNSALQLLKAGNIGTDQIERLATLTANLSSSQQKAVISSKALSTQQRIAILTTQGMSEAEAKAALGAMGLATAEGTATAATTSFSGALKGLWATLMANPFVVIAAGVTAAVSAFSTYKQHVEEVRQATLEAGDAAQDEVNNILELASAYSEVQAAYANGTGAKEGLTAATDELLAALGVEKSALSDLIGIYGSLDQVINQLTIDALTDSLGDMISGYQAAQDELLALTKDSWNPFDQDFGTMNWMEDTLDFGLKIGKILEDAGHITSAMYKQGGMLYLGDTSTLEGATAAYEKLIAMRKTLVSSGLSTEELGESSLYTQINNRITETEARFQKVQSYVDSINRTNAQIDYTKYVRDNGIPKTEQEFKDLRKTMEKSADTNDKYVGTQEDINDAITDTLADVPELSEFFDGYVAEAQDAADALSEVDFSFNIDTKKEDFEKLYAEIQKVEHQRIATMQTEMAHLKQELEAALASGEIEKYSDSWYSMQQAIDDVQEEIDDARISLAEYEKTMREIEWEHFDYVHERISKITNETEFLIDLLSDAKLFGDDGKMTDEGLATMGLYAQSYNIAMEQSKQYAEQLAKIEKEVAEDPYNTDLIERKEELLELQQEAIKAAEDEKQAIVDLVKQGIDAEISSLDTLISKYKESLKSAKSLREYESKISDKTGDIASIQKQISAYINDDSEGGRAKLQSLYKQLEEAQNSLQDLEYEKSISEQEKLLDAISEEYQEVVNSRLDNVDSLIADMIDTVNSNSSAINDALLQATKDVGYTMSESMRTIWQEATYGINNAITTYAEGEAQQTTTIIHRLDEIIGYVSGMVASSDNSAQDSISGVQRYAKGGLVKFTGLAQVDGTPSEPEAFLDAEDTENISDLTATLKALSMQDLKMASSVPQDFSIDWVVPHNILDTDSIRQQIHNTTTNNVSQNQNYNWYGDIKMEVNGVANYKEFMKEIQEDSKFETMIEGMIFDKIKVKGLPDYWGKYKVHW